MYRLELSSVVVTVILIFLQTFNEIQKLLSKTNGQVIGDLMTPAPLVVHETTNLEEAARSFSISLFNFLHQAQSLFCFTPPHLLF